MREIGSEFWDVATVEEQKDIFPESTQWYLSGRSSLQAIIKEIKGCHTVAMPSWCCESMVKPFVDAGIEVRFYPVYWKNGLIQEINLERDALFLIDYFGYTSTVPDLNGYKGAIIRDVTHSIFSATYSDADYYFGSLRKWCGVWTGGFAWTCDSHRLPMEHSDDLDYIHLREKAMNLKKNNIHGQRVTDKQYLKLFKKAEDILEHIGIAPAADRDVWLANRVDDEGIKNRRRSNAGILRSAFPEWLIFHEMRDTDCPMFVPIFVPDGRRNELRNYLISNDIYCPIHWPVSDYHRLDERTEHIYKNELSLVCDQRYSEEDMLRMVERIKTFWKEV